MPSLSQILGEHAPLLLLDAASARIQVGLLEASGTARWSASGDEAGVGVFQCLEDLGADLEKVGAFAFCEGPGSILGIRTTAMALRMWNVLRPRPTYGYFSLSLVARALAPRAVTVIADARRGLWHFARTEGPVARAPAAELAGDRVVPDGFRHWDPLPPGTGRVPYDVADLFAQGPVRAADLFRPAEAPDAFMHQEPAYAKWVPHVHRAP